MNMEECFRALETHVVSRKLNLVDGESVLSLLVWESCIIPIPPGASETGQNLLY